MSDPHRPAGELAGGTAAADTAQPSGAAGDGAGPADGTPPLDTSVPHPARVYDFLLGGTASYPADQELARRVMELVPGIAEMARANRAFLSRAVEYLAGEAGIRQFLDIGAGLPTASNVHQVAQRIAPQARVVYVDNDPLVQVQSRALLAGTPPGTVDFLHADARDPAGILARAARTLDFSQPVGVMMMAVLHFFPDPGQARQVITTVMDAVPPGSYLAVSIAASDIKVIGTALRTYNSGQSAAAYPQPREVVASYFAGLDLVEPGLVTVERWRPASAPGEPFGYAGVARKPG